MSLRGFTQLTIRFGKEVETRKAGVNLHFMLYNLARIHKSLARHTAMEAGMADHAWSHDEIPRLPA